MLTILRFTEKLDLASIEQSKNVPFHPKVNENKQMFTIGIYKKYLTNL